MTAGTEPNPWENQKIVEEHIAPTFDNAAYLHYADLNEFIQRQAAEVETMPGYVLLDYGAGSSPYKKYFSKADYRRADINPAPYLQYVTRPDSTIPEVDGTFDVIISTQVAEHVINPDMYFKECFRLLKPGGRLILTTHGIWQDHGCPYDFQRWTDEGLKRDLAAAGFTNQTFWKLTCGLRAALLFFTLTLFQNQAPERAWPRFWFKLFRFSYSRVFSFLYRLSDRWFDDEKIVSLRGNQANPQFYAVIAVVVVDNGSQTPVAEKFDLTWHPHARHIRENELGLTPARLRGIREATAELLVFVDDDNVLVPDYLAKALETGNRWPFVGAWGGSIEPEFESPVPNWVGDQIWRVSIATVKEDVWSNLREGYAAMPFGAGLCVRREVGAAYLNRCQDQKKVAVLDRKGRELTGYGDIDLAHCALDIGLGLGKTGQLKVLHLIPSSRLTLDYFLRHAEGDAMSLMMFRASRGMPIEQPKPLTWVHRCRWFLHRLKNRVPREQYEITRAYNRGMQRGYAMAVEYWDRCRAAGLKTP